MNLPEELLEEDLVVGEGGARLLVDLADEAAAARVSIELGGHEQVSVTVLTGGFELADDVILFLKIRIVLITVFAAVLGGRELNETLPAAVVLLLLLVLLLELLGRRLVVTGRVNGNSGHLGGVDGLSVGGGRGVIIVVVVVIFLLFDEMVGELAQGGQETGAFAQGGRGQEEEDDGRLETDETLGDEGELEVDEQHLLGQEEERDLEEQAA